VIFLEGKMNIELFIGLVILAGILMVGFVVIYLVIKGMLDRSLDKINEIENNQQMELTTLISQRISEIDLGSRQSFERLKEDIGKLSEATKQMLEVGKTISSLEDLLKPPKIRGGMGETFLEELLNQILPHNYFEFQHSFKNGDKVDAIIRLGGKMVPVDAKFPLEQFRNIIENSNEAERKLARRSFIRDVKKHIDDIANKYILPDEKTFDFALMYIPAENVYYEAVIKEEDEEGLYSYALKKKVIPVSPNSFYAYLQVIIHGLKGMSIEAHAREIINHLERLKGDEKRFKDEFEVLGSHLSNARKKYEDADKLLNRFEEKLLSTGEVEDSPQLDPGNK
jgi:DNA recombination protein RmuC